MNTKEGCHTSSEKNQSINQSINYSINEMNENNNGRMELSMSAEELDHLIWRETEYKLKFILDNPNFPLPQIVRVVQGHMVDEDEALASGQILTIHGKKNIENLLGHDIHQKQVNIPTSCPYKFNIVSMGNPRIFQGVKELCFSEHPPQYIRLCEEYLADNERSVGCDVILQVKDHVIASGGNVIGINCQMVHNENMQTLTLPIHYDGTFVESFSYETTNKTFTVAEMLQEHELPVQIQFVTSHEKSCPYGPHIGVVNLEKKHSVNSVLSTVMIENVRHALTFSTDLPVTVQVPTGKKKISSYNADNVDLKRFDYFGGTSDPYSCITMKNFDDLRTPKISRRDKQRKPAVYASVKATGECPSNEITTADMKTRKQHLNNANAHIKQKSKTDSELGKDLKDIENFFKSKFKFKSIRKSMSKKLKDRSEKCQILSKHSMDLDDSTTYVTSVDDESSIADIRSIGVTSSGSGETCSDSCYAESLTYDTPDSIFAQQKHRRKGSGDSGICISTRKQSQRYTSQSRLRSSHRTRSRSYSSHETRSSTNPSDTCDSLSEWSLPIKDSPASQRKSFSSRSSRSTCLWSADESVDNTTNKQHLWSADESIDNTTNRQQSCGDYNNAYLSNKNNINNYQNISTSSTTTSVKQRAAIESPLPAKHMESMYEIRVLNQDGVVKVLQDIKLNEFASVFIENQINGELLLLLEQDDLVNELGLSLFQAKKIMKYVKGWRPESAQYNPTQTSRRNSLNPRDWSENDVMLNMVTLKLNEFGEFCRTNQVNGDLLLDILDKETLASVSRDHHVKMSNIESKKLLNFVVKGWRPDVSPKLLAGL